MLIAHGLCAHTADARLAVMGGLLHLHSFTIYCSSTGGAEQKGRSAPQNFAPILHPHHSRPSALCAHNSAGNSGAPCFSWTSLARFLWQHLGEFLDCGTGWARTGYHTGPPGCAQSPSSWRKRAQAGQQRYLAPTCYPCNTECGFPGAQAGRTQKSKGSATPGLQLGHKTLDVGCSRAGGSKQVLTITPCAFQRCGYNGFPCSGNAAAARTVLICKERTCMPACTCAALSFPGGEERIPAQGTSFLRLPAAERRALEARGRLADSNHHGCEGCAQCWVALPLPLPLLDLFSYAVAACLLASSALQRRESCLQSRAYYFVFTYKARACFLACSLVLMASAQTGANWIQLR